MEESIEEEFLCIICYELPTPYENNARITACCGQILCRACFNRVFSSPRPRNTCPYCRTPLRSHDNKFVERILHKLHDEKYGSGEDGERPRRHSAPANTGQRGSMTRRPPQRYPSLGSTGKFYCGGKLGPSHMTTRHCCQDECGRGVRCGPSQGCNCAKCMIKDKTVRCLRWDTLVNRDGRTAKQGHRGGFYCGRPTSVSPCATPPLNKQQYKILAGIDDPDEAREVARAIELSLQISGKSVLKCREDAPCAACSCLSNHSDDYL